MSRLIGIFCILLSLASCTLFNMDNNKSNDRYARCKELKRQLLFMNATNNETLEQQRNGEVDNLYRSLREYGC